MTVQIQPLNLADIYTKAQMANRLQTEADAMQAYRQAQSQALDQKTRQRAQAILANRDRGLWNAVKGIADPAQQQQAAEKYVAASRPYLQTALGPLYQDEGPVDLERLRLTADMDLAGGSDEYYGNIVQDEDGNIWQHTKSGRWTKADLGGKRAFERPLTMNQGAGGTTAVDPRIPGRPLANYPTVPESVNGYRPPMASAPPPVAYGGGQEAGATVLDLSNTAIDPNMSDADIGKAIKDLLATGRTPAQGAPANAPALTRLPPFQSRPQPRALVTPQTPVYSGMSDPDYIKHRGAVTGEEERAKNPVLLEREQQKAGVEAGLDAQKKTNENLAKQQGAAMDRSRRANDILNLVGLPGSETAARLDDTIRASTGSTVGNLVDQAVGGLTGQATPGSLKIGELESIGSQLLMSVPRFEGPQSDADRQAYNQAAADIANPTTPPLKRLARLNELRGIMQGYVSGERGRIIEDDAPAPALPQPTPGTSQAMGAQPMPKTPAQFRHIRTNKATGQKQYWDNTSNGWVDMR